jgi:type IV pilus assembly protein PilP
MRKITFVAFSIVTCLFSTDFFALASDIKNVLPAVSSTPAAVRLQESGQPPLPKAPPPESSYNYSPLAKTDPFRPFVEEEPTAKQKIIEKKEVLSIFPLQRLDVDKFRIVGIAGDYGRRIAIAEDAAKKYYPLSIGTHIGLHKGKVTDILSDRVIIEEHETKKPRRIILRLHKNQTEVKP